MVALLPNPELQFIDADGHPYAGGTLETYQPGTTTPKSTWLDPNKAALNTNPIVLDAAGRCIVFGDGAYRCILRDSVGNLVFDQYSDTIVSAAMQPVMSAATIADAVALLGIDDMVAAEAAARAAADSAEQTARIAADNALGVRIDGEIARATAAEAALDTRVDALEGVTAPTLPSIIKGSDATTDASGHVHITFATPFPSECASFVACPVGAGLYSVTLSVTKDRYGADVWATQAGSPIAKTAGFNWLAIGT